MSFFGAQPQAPAVAPEAKDIEVTNLPTDSISAISFSPTSDFLAVASWSNEVSLLSCPPCAEPRQFEGSTVRTPRC